MSAGLRIRPFGPDDIPQVVTLRQQVFRYHEQATPDALAEYFDAVFFRNPWVDPELPSLVCEDSSGTVIGFLGVIPRPMRFRGKPVRGAVATQFMSAPGGRGGVGRRMARAFMAGAQDVMLSDTANEAARRIWAGVGGTIAPVQSVAWVCVLRPCRYAASRLASNAALRAALLLARPFCAVADALVRGAAPGPLRQAEPPGTEEPCDAGTLLALFDHVAASRSLVPVYNRATLEWLLGEVLEKRHLGSLERWLVRAPGGELAGWFIYSVQRGGVGQVIHLGARAGRESLVLEHLFHHARRRGAVALAGRADPALLPELVARGCRLTRRVPWVLVHSPRPEIAYALERGDVFLSRLEGEWWLSF